MLLHALDEDLRLRRVVRGTGAGQWRAWLWSLPQSRASDSSHQGGERRGGRGLAPVSPMYSSVVATSFLRRDGGGGSLGAPCGTAGAGEARTALLQLAPRLAAGTHVLRKRAPRNRVVGRGEQPVANSDFGQLGVDWAEGGATAAAVQSAASAALLPGGEPSRSIVMQGSMTAYGDEEGDTSGSEASELSYESEDAEL